jgi:hypothetical protein
VALTATTPFPEEPGFRDTEQDPDVNAQEGGLITPVAFWEKLTCPVGATDVPFPLSATLAVHEPELDPDADAEHETLTEAGRCNAAKDEDPELGGC